MKKINNLLIDTSEMPAAATSRRVTVNTEIGAKFTLQVINNPSSSSDMTKYLILFLILLQLDIIVKIII